MKDELRELDRALCSVLNGAFDPYEPVDLWRDEIWNAMSFLGRAYNEAHMAKCFPDWKDDPARLPERKSFRNWQHEVQRAHGPHRVMVLSDENSRPISAEALTLRGKHIAYWSRTETAQKQPTSSETNVNESATDGA